MSWAVGFDHNWRRDIGYGVPATCDHPDCNERIDRGLAYVCGGEPWGGEHGCGLFFCSQHRTIGAKGLFVCERCDAGASPFQPKPDHPEWLEWKLTDESWAAWRAENPLAVAEMESALRAQGEAREPAEGER